ncbi:MAG: PHP domain-containing protein [Armatimonadia bacterium]
MAGEIALDLHVHTVLSPCATAQMTPPAVLLLAERQRLDIIGIVDHGTAGNAAAFAEAAPAFRVRVVVGLEVETAEGVHVLALFDTPGMASSFESALQPHLPHRPNRPDLFGDQWLVDSLGNVVGEEERLLLTAVDLGLSELTRTVTGSEGLAIPAHVDREAYGLYSVLGFLPDDLEAEVLELSPWMTPEQARARWPELAEKRLVRGSDAHCLDDLGRAVTRGPEGLREAPVRDWAGILGR